LIRLLYRFHLFFHDHGLEICHVWVSHPMHHLVSVLGALCENFVLKLTMSIQPEESYLRTMLEDQDFRIVLAKLACLESIFQLVNPLLFGLSSILHWIEHYMKIVGYESSFIVFDQCGVIALQDILVTDFSHNEPVWDMKG
jgi:hypothetical protein